MRQGAGQRLFQRRPAPFSQPNACPRWRSNAKPVAPVAAAASSAAAPGAAPIAPGAAGKLSSSLFEPLDVMEPAPVPVHTNGSSAFGDDDDDVDVPPFMRH